jgi:hypothetical protein
MKRWAICLISHVETQYISTGVGIKVQSQKCCFHPHFSNATMLPPLPQCCNQHCHKDAAATVTRVPKPPPLPQGRRHRRRPPYYRHRRLSAVDHHTMDAYIVDAWMRRGDREDDDAYEGCKNLGPPNNVAAAVECENQRAASATTPLAMSANKEEVCAPGTFCTAEANNNVNKSAHRCLCSMCINNLEGAPSLNEPHAEDKTAVALASSTSRTMKMAVSTVGKHVQAKSPIVSTANKINAQTAAKKKVNKGGKVVSAVKVKDPRIKNGVWVFSTKSQLISLVKQGDPCYDNLRSATSNGFCF